MNITREAPLRSKLEWFPDGGVDVGIFEKAFNDGKTVSMLLEEWKSKKLGEPTPYYGLTRKQILAKKQALKSRGEPVPMEALDECFKAAGIRAFGPVTDTVGKMFEYSDIDVLFAEYVSNRVYAGLIKESLVPQLIALETVLTEGLDYRKIYISDSEEERQTGIVGLGAELAETFITVSDQSVKLKKYGRYVSMAFEDIKYQRLNLFGVAMERIGLQIQVDETDDLIYTLINGDGNSGTTPGKTIESDTTGTIAKADIIEFITGAPTPYRISNIIGKKAILVDYYDALTGMYNPMNAYNEPTLALPKVHEWNRSVMTSDYLMGIDKRYSIEYVTAGGVQTDSEKLVKKQTKGTGIWYLSNFGIIDNNANVIFDRDHS